MKKILPLLVISLIFSLVSAQEVNFENLKSAHISAMKQNGHAPLLAERNNKMVFISLEQGIASACYGESLCTAYMERGDIKVYWFVEKIEGGVLITVKITIGENTYTRSFKILMSENEVRFQNLDFNKEDASRLSIDWDCLKSKIPGCITCLVNWPCWLVCAGSAVWGCVKW